MREAGLKGETEWEGRHEDLSFIHLARFPSDHWLLEFRGPRRLKRRCHAPDCGWRDMVDALSPRVPAQGRFQVTCNMDCDD